MDDITIDDRESLMTYYLQANRFAEQLSRWNGTMKMGTNGK